MAPRHVRHFHVRSARSLAAAVLFAVVIAAPWAQEPAPASGPAGDAQAASGPDQTTSAPTAPKAPAPETPEATAAGSDATAKEAPAASDKTVDTQGGGITEEELKQMLVGKTFYLRGGYLDDTLNFNEHGGLASRSPVGSYTLSLIEIDHVHLTKHKVELDGVRYGQHFLGALAYEDPTKAVDRVRVTPKKKQVKITIDREQVVKPKKEKAVKGGKGEADETKPADAAEAKASAAKPTGVIGAQPVEAAEAKPEAEANGTQPAATGAESASAAPETTGEEVKKTGETEKVDAGEGEGGDSAAEQLKASIAAAPESERPADPDSVTTTLSPGHATAVLKDALDKMFAPGLDERMMAAMPDFWKLYYQAVAAKTDYHPTDPGIYSQAKVDTKAKLLTRFEPESNQFAQDNGIAGMALYHAVIGADGKPEQVAVARPIGFGLDENAVKSIRNAKFDPAMKDGHPVPVLLDLVVQFRIFSKRTAVSAPPPDPTKPVQPQLPGPYTARHPTE